MAELHTKGQELQKGVARVSGEVVQWCSLSPSERECQGINKPIAGVSWWRQRLLYWEDWVPHLSTSIFLPSLCSFLPIMCVFPKRQRKTKMTDYSLPGVRHLPGLATSTTVIWSQEFGLLWVSGETHCEKQLPKPRLTAKNKHLEDNLTDTSHSFNKTIAIASSLGSMAFLSHEFYTELRVIDVTFPLRSGSYILAENELHP